MISAFMSRRRYKLSRSFSAIARSVMISAASMASLSLLLSSFSAIARSVMISAKFRSTDPQPLDSVSVL